MAEAVIAEFSAPGRRGRNIGLFEIMVGTTFILGPALLVWVGPLEPAAFWLCTAFMVGGFVGGFFEDGITLVNNTAVLVLTYTLGSICASASSGALLQWSPTFGFPLLLAAVALAGWIALLRARYAALF